MEPEDPPISRSAHPNREQPSPRRSSYNYHRIAGRHARPQSSISLKTVFFWICAAITVVLYAERFRAQPARPQSELVVSEPIMIEEYQTNRSSDPAPLMDPGGEIQAISAVESAPPTPLISQPAQDVEEQTTDHTKSERFVEVRLSRDKSGNYVGPGLINQKQVQLLADTGASVVVIPEKIARQIGLKAGKALQFRTAGGLVTHYATTLDSVSIGPIQIQHVHAVINPSMQEDFALLGMNVLELLHMKQEDGNLILSYPASKNKAGASNANGATGEPAPFKRSLRQCLGAGKTIDQRTLNCLNGR